MNCISGVQTYYFIYVTGDKGLFSIFTMFAGFAEIFGLIIFPKLAKRMSKKQVYGLASGIPVIGLIILLIIGIVIPKNYILTAVAGICVKLGSGLQLGTVTVVLADVVDYGEFKLGTRNESIVFSVQTLLVKGASAVAGWLVGVGLSLVGYVAGEVQSATTILGMRVIMIWIPIVCAIVMYTIYKSKYKINGKFHDDMLVELEKRKKANDAI